MTGDRSADCVSVEAPPLQDIRVRLQRGTVWISASQLLTNLLGLLSTLILARALTPADFGLVALGTTLLAVITSVTELSLSSALVQHKNPTKAHLDTAWTLGFLRSLVVAAAFALAAVPAAALYRDPRLVWVMLALAGSVVVSGVGNPRAIMLTRDLVFWQQFALRTSQKLASLIAAVVVALIYHSYWALIVGSVAGQAVGVVVSYAVFPFRPSIGWRHSRELLSFSMWLTFAQMANTINYKFDQLLIGGYLGRGPLGLYTMGDNLAVMPTRETTTPLFQTLFPAFARLHDDPERLSAAYQKAQTLITAIVLPLGIGFALVADPLVRLTIGVKWLAAVQVIQVLAAVFALQTLGTLAQPLAMAAAETKLLFKRDLQGFAFRIPFIFLGMYYFGLAGVIFARALTGSLAILLNFNVVKRITGLSFADQLGANWRTLLASLTMAAAVLAVTAWMGAQATAAELMLKLAVSVSVGAATYCAASFALWAIAGRPAGPETEGLRLASALFGKSLQPARLTSPGSQA
jgi:lipopolysaccharide exporter